MFFGKAYHMHASRYSIKINQWRNLSGLYLAKAIGPCGGGAHAFQTLCMRQYRFRVEGPSNLYYWLSIPQLRQRLALGILAGFLRNERSIHESHPEKR